MNITTTPTDCPGAGRCHTSSWCPDCDATEHGPCDQRGRCDRHRSSGALRLELAELEASAEEQRGFLERTRAAAGRAAAHAAALQAAANAAAREWCDASDAAARARSALAAAVADEQWGDT